MAAMQSSKKTETVTTLERPDGNSGLTESEVIYFLGGTLKGICRSPEETHVDLRTPEAARIPEIQKPFGK